MKPLALLTLATLFALTACVHGGGSSSSTQSATTQTSPQAAASPGAEVSAQASAEASPMTAASPSAAAPPATVGSIPSYPGSSNVMTETSNGETASESTTKDSFDVVYAWYKSHLPTGSETERLTIGNVQEAAFKVGDSTVSIASSNGQTVITIANKQ